MIFTTDIAIILPVYNEEFALQKVIDDIRGNINNTYDYEIFVINNNSTDKSKEIALKNKCIVIDEYRQGKGYVLKRAFEDINANCYICVDADDTYDLSEINNFISLVLNENYDMIIGDRLSTDYYTENKRKFHNFGNNLIRFFINKMFKGEIADMLTGFRAFSKRFVKTFPIASDGFQIETEMTIYLLDNGYRYKCVPVGYKDRDSSNPSKLNTYKDGFKVIHMLVQMFKEYKPNWYYGIISLILTIISTCFIIPVLETYNNTGMVYRFPTLIVCCFTYLMAFLFFFIGIILNNRRKSDKKMINLKILSI
mgnify:CR=1 FL=1|jgi:glycosyltransferase involved in cell wall biosynthesis